MTTAQHYISIFEKVGPLAIYRYRQDKSWHHGANSAEAFRDDVLIPALRQAQAAGARLEIDFTGLEGCSAAFLHEAFGGLYVLGEWTPEVLLATIKFMPEKTYYDIYLTNARGFLAGVVDRPAPFANQKPVADERRVHNL